MSEAPERIWIEDEFGEGDDDQWTYGTWDVRNYAGYDVEYVRADIVQTQTDEVQPDLLEAACIAAHNAYEQAAHEAGWVTNTQSRKPWADVPEANKIAMRAGIAAAIALFRKGEQP